MLQPWCFRRNFQGAGQDEKVGGIQACLHRTLRRGTESAPTFCSDARGYGWSGLIEDQHGNMLCGQAEPKLCALLWATVSKQ